VLPTHRLRFAVTVWFIDALERDATAAKNKLDVADAAAATSTTSTTSAAYGTATAADVVIEKADDTASAGRVSSKAEPVPSHQLGEEEGEESLRRTQKAPMSGCTSSGDMPTASDVPAVAATVIPSSSSGEIGEWDNYQHRMIYRIQFSDPALVQYTLVDVVNKNTLFIHASGGEKEFKPVSIVITLPADTAHLTIQEERTTAKYSKKKNVLTVSLFFN
jgi:hypothetical protein